MNTGHYFSNSYEQAKQDFSIRCGLVDRHALFDHDQMKAIYRNISEYIENSAGLGYDDIRERDEIRKQICSVIPELGEDANEIHMEEI